uniref:Receptor-interacting serine/threonine-protein kinase 4-like isoform X2 n=1 Tax=Crassostrea virginica TaxID=6565 RepID=A0A8B8EFP2_CRAVI|nr:receptor-interacting serine/threonine-protein kinase 4-like isoform X2 [Crassostrea virginica]XP_022338438.1 receptor-interacting serine/threonine-protein kinase 4-like isoform X3 [Crassostrea virginica]
MDQTNRRSYADMTKKSKSEGASTSKDKGTSKSEGASTSKDKGTSETEAASLSKGNGKNMIEKSEEHFLRSVLLLMKYGGKVLQHRIEYELQTKQGQTVSAFLLKSIHEIIHLTFGKSDKCCQTHCSIPSKPDNESHLHRDYLNVMYQKMRSRCAAGSKDKCSCCFKVKPDLDMSSWDITLTSRLLLEFIIKDPSQRQVILNLRSYRNSQELLHRGQPRMDDDQFRMTWGKVAHAIMKVAEKCEPSYPDTISKEIEQLKHASLSHRDFYVELEVFWKKIKDTIENVAQENKLLWEVLIKCKELLESYENKELKGCEDDASYGSYEYKPAPVPYPKDGAEDVFPRNSPLTEEEKENQEKELFLNACKTGNQDDEDVIKMMKIDVNFFSQDGKTPLYLASRHGHLSIVKMLLGKGAEVNLCNENGDGPLHAACQNGNINIVDRLIQKGANINSVSSDGSTPLYLASLHGHESIVHILLGKGAEVNQCNKNGDGPLHAACQKGNVNIVQQLVNMTDIDINAINSSQCTPLQKACWDGYETIVKSLLEKGAKVNPSKEKTYGPLHIACRNGHHKVADILLANNADINFQGADGNTPIILACKNGMKKTFELLLNYGADLKLCNDDGYCPRVDPDFLKLIVLHETKQNRR